MFVLVPDMAAPGAYDEAMQDVDLIIHSAAPLHTDQATGTAGDVNLEDAFVTACVQGNLGILKSACDKGKRVRRVVMTSSTAAIAPADFYSDTAAAAQREAGNEVVRGPDTRVHVPTPPYKSQLHAYCSAKAASLKAAEDYIKDHSPHFDLISIMPSLIFGKDELATGTGSTGMMMSRLLPRTDANGGSSDSNNHQQGEIAAVGNAVLCSDVARAHVRALDTDIEGNQSFVLNADAKWEDTVPISKTHFPREFESGLFRPGGPHWTTVPLKWDTNKVRDILGIELASYDAMVKEVVSEYIETTSSE
ncbi:LysM domain-containing protein [Apiospora arundinis]